jgi:Fe-Mn family superoxide dismutase
MFVLPALPYAYDALEPVISAKTFTHHHDRHHAKYVEVLNGILKEKPALEGKSMEVLIVEARASGEKKLFNQAAQSWNHAFFWECLSPVGGPPTGALAERIAADFGSLDALKAAFVKEGVGHFASGWVWLALDGEALKIVSTHDAETLIGQGLTPLLVADLWEHAYYLDHQQNREGFLNALFGVINWDFVARQYAARGGEGAYAYPLA